MIVHPGISYPPSINLTGYDSDEIISKGTQSPGTDFRVSIIEPSAPFSRATTSQQKYRES